MNIDFRLDKIHNVAEQLWQLYSNYKVWAFHGLMGTGKTTLIHAVCSTLRVADVVSSPTFAVINEYTSKLAGTIYHMDWYRLKNEEEAVEAGVEDCLFSGNVCFIEWPERAENLLPTDTLHFFIDILNEDTRKLSASK